MTAFTLTAIGHVRSGRVEREDDEWGDVDSVIRLDADRCSPDSLRGLDEFSHIEVIFLFDRFDEARVHTGARRPRGNPNWPEVGIFAQRASSRPNRLGLTSCEVLAVDGLDVRVRGLDAIDGTPVLDIKPYVREFAPRGEVRQPAWVTELMAGYW